MEFDFNITGLELETAKELLMDVARALGDTEYQMNKKREELALWQNRLELAQQHGRADLIAEAGNKVSALQPQIDQLFIEAKEIRRGIAFMKEQLKSPSFQVHRSTNADLLLEEMKMMIGVQEDQDLASEEKWKSQSADDALAALKAEMEGKSGTGDS
jgi:phage shock protein A